MALRVSLKNSDRILHIKKIAITCLALNIALSFGACSKNAEEINDSASAKPSSSTTDAYELLDESGDQKETDYNLLVVSNDYIDIVLEKITTEGLEFSITSKLKNNKIKVNLENIALDGVAPPHKYNDSSAQEISPQQTITAYYNVDLRYTDHELFSMSYIIFNEDGNGKSYSICEYSLGGTYNKEPVETDIILLYDSDNISVWYGGAQEEGVKLLIQNKIEDRITFGIGGHFAINGEEKEGTISVRTYPPKSIGTYLVYAKDIDFDYSPNDINSFSATGELIVKSRKIEEFAFASDKPATPLDQISSTGPEMNTTQDTTDSKEAAKPKNADAPSEQEEQTNTEESPTGVYAGYLEASNIYFKDLEYNQTTKRYSYKGYQLPSKETDWYEQFGKAAGTDQLNHGALYSLLVRRVETFYEGGELLYPNWKGNMPLFFDFEAPATWQEMKPYIAQISTFITDDNSLMAIFKKFSTMDSVEGTFDFTANSTSFVSGSYDFTIQSLSDAADEMGIADNTLGYILAFIDAYEPDVEIDNNSYSCKISFPEN